MRKFSVIAVLFIFTTPSSFAQAPGAALFDNSIVHEIKIISLYESLQDTLTSNYVLSFGIGQMQLRDIPYAPSLLVIDGTPTDTVGIRYKGFNSWWSSVKKPIKVDLDKYVSHQKYDGLSKFNLHNGAGDPTFIRENTIYKILRALGVNAPRTSYAKVFIDTTYLGIYRLVEQVDNTFLDVNFGNHDGNLYAQQSKGSGGFSLDWLGSEKENYYQSLALENHKKKNDWTSLIHFLDVLNNSKDENFKHDISSVFAVDEYLQILAVDIAMNNIDSYGTSGRNYYLAEIDGKFHWIPWDYNLTWQSDPGTINIQPDDYPVLIRRILSIPEFYNLFLQKFCALQPYLNDKNMSDLIADELTILKPYMETDPFLDYPLNAFETNMHSTWENLPGLKEYSVQRSQDINATLNDLGINCDVVIGIPQEEHSGLQIYPVPANNTVTFEIASIEEASVSVLNLLGQPVLSFSIQQTKSLDISLLPSGSYVVKAVIDNNRVYSDILLVSH